MFFLAGNLAFLLTGTPQQFWADPLGNALLVAGAFSVWAGSLSLRQLPMPRWQLIAAPAITALASALENPASNEWSGGLVYLGMMTIGMALAARQLWLLEYLDSHVHLSLSLAAGVLAAFFLCRWPVYLLEGPESQTSRTYFSPAVASMLTIALLVTGSFSMTALSNEQLIKGLNERTSRDDLNRKSFMELATRVAHRLNASGSVSTLLLADLDHFKALNDGHGHAAGDAAIQAFALACIASVRSTDIVGRYGGEEFIMLLPGAGQETAQIIASDISRVLAEAPAPPGIAFPTVSYGVATSTIAHADVHRMIEAADAALYEAKALGRNRVVLARP